MRFVVAQPGPSFSVHDVYTGWVEALRELGQKVVAFNLDERLTFYSSALKQVGAATFAPYLSAEQSYELAINGLYAALYKARPDVLLVVSGFFVPPLLLERAQRSGTRVVLLHTECPYEDERQLALAPCADINLVDDPTNIGAYRALAPTYYVPKSYRPGLHRPGPAVAELVCDLAFVGTGFVSRIDFLQAMDLAGLDVLLAGNWTQLDHDSPLRPYVAHDVDQCLDNADAAAIYRSARLGLNLYRREAQRPELAAGWAMGPREVEMAACGLFFLREPRGEGDEVLDMLPTFGAPEECSDLVRHWLARPDERAELAAKAAAAIADRTFANHAAALLRLLDA